MNRSWITKSPMIIGHRWDHGYHAFEQLSFFDSWSKKFELVPLGDIIQDGSYGILTPGDVYFSEHPITYVRVTDMRDNLQIHFGQSLKVPEEYYRHRRARLKKYDVILAVKGASIASNKSVAFIDREVPSKTIVNGTIFRFQVKAPHNPFYVAVMLDSEILKGQIRKLQIPNNAVSYIDKPSIHALRIPLPPRLIQDCIAQIMQDAYAKQQNKLSEAERLYQTIDNYVFSRLGITFEDVEEKKRFIKPITEIYGSRFDVDFNMGFHKFDPYINQVLPVKAVAKFPKRTRELSNEAEAVFQYIDISSIDIQLGKIERAIEITEASAPSRARQVVHTGDIIVSTVRPTRGAIALIQNEMEGFICSTGFTIIHPTKEVSSAYLHLALRLSTTLEQFKRRSAGSSYPAILESDIQETLIPLPDKEVQNEIATEVTQRCNEAKSLRIKAENLVNEAKAHVKRMILGEEEVT